MVDLVLCFFKQVKKFGDMISTIGADVLKAIAIAGPANQVRTGCIEFLIAVHTSNCNPPPPSQSDLDVVIHLST